MWPAATSSRAKKTTTPTASLKSDSPAIWTSRRFGARAVRSMPRTAIGSVGETIAPKSRLSRRSERETADARHQQRQPADDRRRDRDADGRQRRDQGLFAEERVEVDLQGPREQQERQHPVEQRLAEMQPRHQLAREVVDGRAERAGRHQRQRGHQRPDRHADRGRQAAEAAVDSRRERPLRSRRRAAESGARSSNARRGCDRGRAGCAGPRAARRAARAVPGATRPCGGGAPAARSRREAAW